MQDKYIKDYIKEIKEAKDDADLETIIDNIYNDGFEDALNDYNEHETSD